MIMASAIDDRFMILYSEPKRNKFQVNIHNALVLCDYSVKQLLVHILVVKLYLNAFQLGNMLLESFKLPAVDVFDILAFIYF